MIIDFYKDSEEQKVLKMKQYLENIFEKDVEVILDIIDPRINHFDCFVDIDNFDKITEIYSNAQIEEETVSVIVPNEHINFTIYKVSENEKEYLINKIKEENEKKKEELSRENVIF